MTVLAYRFIAGRYHATPWGAHVNEGLVEWPPSPYRLLRALVATGFSRFQWSGIEGPARELFDLLTPVLPAYSLPRGTASHTRHYMPPFKGNTTKVIDAFLRFPTNSTLYVNYGVSLPDSAKAQLRALVRAQPYLGRAEAWVEGELLESPPEGLEWLKAASQPSVSGYERVELLASEEPEAYSGWRATFVARELAAKEAEERSKAAAKGKAFKNLSKADRAKLEERAPIDTVSALLQDTSSLRKAGWNQPPGTRWVGYFRPRAALVPRVESAARRAVEARPTTALLALSSDTTRVDVFPPVADAIRRLDALHDALVKASDDGTGPSPCFTGKSEGNPLGGHRHATLIPLTLGTRRDRLDHVLVYCPMGFDERARAALLRVRKTWAAGLPDLFVTLAGMGAVEDFGRLVPVARPATEFQSLTPFVPVRFLKAHGKDTLFEQVQRELAFRGLPAATDITIEMVRPGVATSAWIPAASAQVGKRAGELWADGDGTLLRPTPRFRHFILRRASRPPPTRLGLSLRLRFASRVFGPVSLGYGSHFGLGAFTPLVRAT